MAINWIPIYKQYKGKWIALDSDEKTVYGSGKSAKVAYQEALKNGVKDPILSFVPMVILPRIG